MKKYKTGHKLFNKNTDIFVTYVNNTIKTQI